MIEHYKLIPGKLLPRRFEDAVLCIKRPYIPITEKQYNEILREAKALKTDILVYNGTEYTFGNADGGYALMPIADMHGISSKAFPRRYEYPLDKSNKRSKHK